ncbi:MAG TPA: hypothetical protein VIU40_15725, partial [Geobacteraceae bacterium]
QEHDMQELLAEGSEALKKGDTATALSCYEKLFAVERSPEVCSSLAFCLAKEKGAYREAISLCNEAIKKEPKQTRHFLLLGRIYVLADRKKEALRAFHLGLRHGGSPEIEAELRRLGTRKPPVIPFLKRENPINKYLGKLLYKWGLR